MTQATVVDAPVPDSRVTPQPEPGPPATAGESSAEELLAIGKPEPSDTPPAGVTRPA